MESLLDSNLNRIYSVAWIPSAQNATMPPDLRPVTTNGFFMAYSRLIHPPVARAVVKEKEEVTKTETTKPVQQTGIAATKLRPTLPEPPPVKGLTKERPVKIGYLESALLHRIDSNAIRRAKNVFVKKGKFTESVFNEIINHTIISNYPAAINTVMKIKKMPAALENAKAYLQGSFILPFNGVAQTIDLIWLPRQENLHVEAGMMPADSSDAFYFMADHYIQYLNNEMKMPVYTVPSTVVAKMNLKNKKALQEVPVGNVLETHYGFHAYEPLRSLGYSDDEYERIILLASKYYKPEGLEFKNLNKQTANHTNYKAYKIIQYDDGYGLVRLYWAPKEENELMPPTLQPLTDEGVYFFTRGKQEEENKAITTKILINKPVWEMAPELYTYYANGGTDKQLEEKERAVQSAIKTENESRMVATTQPKKPKEILYGKYSSDNVYKEEEKIINYLKQSDYELNPLLDKILRSGKDAWILYKTRERAMKLINSQISTIENFLKEYGEYTSPGFKADVEGRLATATAVKYKI